MQNSRNLRALLKSSSLALALTIGVATGAEAGNPWEIISIDAATTTVIAINGSSTILGKFFRADGIQHGFLQAPDGTVTTFDDPAAANATIPTALSANGTVAGYLDNGTHGFIRDPKGNIQTFDVPGSVGSTVARAINAQGTVAGSFQDGPITTRGFLRAADGTFETFAPPDATSVTPVAINGHGTIAGEFNDSHGSEHVFVRNRLGRITVFDVPGRDIHLRNRDECRRRDRGRH